jgi:hypothetical protein
VSYTIKLFLDGGEWCALIGRDLVEGTAGFGATQWEALDALHWAMLEKGEW